MIKKELMRRVVEGTRAARLYIVEKSFGCFFMYYFSEFFVFKIAPFHWDMYRDLEEFAAGKFVYLLWVAFRESAKTSIAKAFVVWCIVFRKKRFVNWDSYDKDNAEAALFDITVWLQTNRRLISDFGQLFYEDPRTAERHARKKAIGEFVTSNGVKVKAYSTQESTRGRIYNRFRPDLYVVEDFETVKTADSPAVTAKIIAHVDELKSGLSVDGQVLFLGNLITEAGSVASLVAEAEANPASWRYRRVDAIMEDKIMWEDKFVRTIEEAAAANAAIADRSQRKTSLEQKKKDLNAGGRKIFEKEMLNSPEAAGEAFFDRDKVDAAIKAAAKRPPLKTVGGFSMWEEYFAKRRYALGGDTAKGVNRDSCADALVRFSEVEGKSAAVIGTYSSATIAPDDFGDEMAAHGRMFGECLVCPELNNTGFATVTRLKAIYPKGKIHRQERKDAVGKVVLDQLGWEANSVNVSEIYYQFRGAFEDGLLDVFCPKLLAEMRKFTKQDLHQAVRRSESALEASGLATRHFDLLRAACIAWEMRHHAKVAKTELKYKQGAYQSPSEYHG